MSAWPTNALTERLGIELPIVQAPMAGAGTVALAAAVANAGGLGSLGLGATDPHDIAGELVSFRSQSNGALNANFFVHEEPGDVSATGGEMREKLKPWYEARGFDAVPEPETQYATFGEAHLEQVRQLKPQVVSFHFGLPEKAMLDAVKETGACVLSSATTVKEARWLEENGADVIIAQGVEAGGHRGMFLDDDPTNQPGLFALLPQVASAVSVPVIAAGGIVDGRGIAAAMMLGASAAQIGTAFLRCPEVALAPFYREALSSAQAEDTRVTKLYSGRPARGIRNALTEALWRDDHLAAPYPAQLSLVRPMMGAGTDNDRRDVMPMWSGQGAALSREMPAADLVRLLADEAGACFRRFA